MKAWRAALGGTLLLLSGTASASEIFAGLLSHDVNTPLSLRGLEGGYDVQVGWRGEPILALGPVDLQPHAFASVNTDGGVNFAAAGVSWRLGNQVYIRPGVGLAVHDAPSYSVARGRRSDFGSRVLFAPELGIGVQISERVSVEASWVHISHAQLFSDQNPGMDSIGVRLNYKLR